MDSLPEHLRPYPPSIRQSVIDVLEILASPDEQLEYQRNVPIADVPAELLCMWFDDSFRPNDTRLAALFTSDEWNGLLAFHNRYDHLSSRLPDDLPPISELVTLPIWQEVVRAAAATLTLFCNGQSTGDSPVA